VDNIILIAPTGTTGPLRGLIDRLASVGVTVTVADEIAAAAELAARQPRPPAVMLDLRDHETAEDEQVRRVTEAVRHALEVLPHALPIVLIAGATAPLILAAVRAGAGDVLDLLIEGTAAARAAVQRVCQRQADRQLELSVMEEQRAIIEELLKDLIRTERRAIDAEDTLAARGRSSRQFQTSDLRPAAVLLVESERGLADELAELLEAAGLAAFAYVSGEEAVREAAMLAETTGIDLALVATRLPGVDGIETVRLLRERIAGLPAFLMAPPGDEERAAGAAELGILEVVQKPIADLEALAAQITKLAQESRHRARESVYLQRIKERHEHVLERYRSLPRTP
jgi:DNA-binding NtrC family response regulator